ncbi:hypothetical protein [Mycetohabitans rhizoxinica]|uniref:hypothetical protein n=1 Tax=Mycetohabitans TaxID=2571159 RepID=UPI0039F4ADF2
MTEAALVKRRPVYDDCLQRLGPTAIPCNFYNIGPSKTTLTEYLFIVEHRLQRMGCAVMAGDFQDVSPTQYLSKRIVFI